MNNSERFAGIAGRVAGSMTAAEPSVIMVINDDGYMLTGDGRWTRFGSFGSSRKSIKTFRSVGQAKRRADIIGGNVVLIEGEDYEVEAAGKVIRRVPSDEPGYETMEHHKLEDFIVYRGKNRSGSITAGGMVSELLKIRPGKHKTFKLAEVGDHSTLYAHIWFDDDVAKTDFGNHVPDSGEWQIIFTLKDKPGGREQARETFRYAEPHRREEIAAYAVRWMKDTVGKVARRLR